MDEARARALLEHAAGTESPPSRVDIELARSLGRKKLRRRRVGLAGAPALAALACVAVIIGALGTSGGSGHAASGTAGSWRVTAPKRFNPLIPYAAFGWLPRGESLNGGQIAPTNAYLTAGPSNAWALTVYAARRCDLTSQQVLRQLRQHRNPKLNCTETSSSGWLGTVASQAPSVDGHLAFWTAQKGYLIWEYARGGWATLAGPRGRTAIRDTVKVADHVRYDVATKPSVEFPVQLTGLPSAWRVAFTYFVSDAGVLRASEYSLTGGPHPLSGLAGNAPILTTDPASAASSCYVYPGGESVRQVIDGYRVVVTNIPAVRGNSPVRQVCAAHADGLMIFISTYGKHSALDAVAIFARHMRLLGTNPADWTTRPLA